MLIERLQLKPDDLILDVATGTGFTALAMRPLADRIVGLDLTWEMLAEGRRLAGGRPGIDWIQGDVEALPFGDQTFSVVTCRRSTHHFPDLDRALEEMMRVLRVGGRLGIVDQVSPEKEAGRQLLEEVERLRDPSHAGTLTPQEWRTIAAAHGVDVLVAEVIEQRIPSFEEWLDRAGVDAGRRRKIASRLAQASLAARAEIGYRGGAAPTFLRRLLVLIGYR